MKRTDVSACKQNPEKRGSLTTFLVSELSVAVSDTHGGIVTAGVKAKRLRRDDIGEGEVFQATSSRIIPINRD